MSFLVFLFFSVVYLYVINKLRLARFNRVILLSLFALAWTLFVGGQYGVGTDYFAYHRVFENPENFRIDKSREYVFYYLISVSKTLWDTPLATFCFIAFISITTLLSFSNFSVKRQQQWLFFFLFIVVSTAFNNQFNAIRQYLATYVLSLGFVSVLHGRYKVSALLGLLASGIHASAILALVVLLVVYWFSSLSLKKGHLVVILLLSMMPVLFMDVQTQVLSLMEFSGNTHYINHKYFNTLDFSGVVVKMFNLLIYLLLLLRVPFKVSDDPICQRLYIVGYLAYAIKMLSLVSTVTNRFGMFFEVLMILPLVFAIDYFLKRNSALGITTCVVFLLVYAIKVTIFASGEYYYDSVFF